MEDKDTGANMVDPMWDKGYSVGREVGRKEVVDYIKSEGDWDGGLFIFGFAIDVDIWNAKLKEWGI